MKPQFSPRVPITNDRLPVPNAISSLLAGALIALTTVSLSAQELNVGVTDPNETLTLSSGTNSYASTYLGVTTNSSNNLLTIANPGTLLTNSAALYVGFYTPGNSLVISNGAEVADSYGVISPYTNTASNNSALITGERSTWTNSENLFVGQVGPDNSLVISNGGEVKDEYGVISFTNSASNNTVLVTGGNSLWINSADLNVGYVGSGNSLVLSNGGKVLSGLGFVGSGLATSNNSVLVTGTKTEWKSGANINIGDAGSDNSMVISNGGNSSDLNGVIGYTNTSSNNSVLVTGIKAIWTNSQGFFVGYYGPSNSLTISNGGNVDDLSATVGNFLSASNNSVSVTGKQAVWSNNTVLNIGYAGSGNSLAISYGGIVGSKYCFIGNTNTASNNSVIVSGAGSSLMINSNLIIGAEASNNNFTISNGGKVVDQVATIGFAGSSNSAMVVGTGSLWENKNDLFIGNNDSDNSLIISNRGQVVDVYASIGTKITSSNNVVLVTGTNSLLQSAKGLYIGNYGSGNCQVVSNGGKAQDTYGYIGYGVGASNNSLLVTGNKALWSTKSLFAVGYAGSGTLTIASGGTVTAGQGAIIGSQSNSGGVVNLGTYGASDTNVKMTTPAITFGAGSGTLNFNQADTLAVTSAINGSNRYAHQVGNSALVQQLGSGTTILSGKDSYKGTTVIAAGTLETASIQALGNSSVLLEGGNLFLHSALSISSLDWVSTNSVIDLNKTPGGTFLTVDEGITLSTNGVDDFELSNYPLSPKPIELMAFNPTNVINPDEFGVLGLTVGYTLSLSNSARMDSLWLTEEAQPSIVTTGGFITSGGGSTLSAVPDPPIYTLLGLGVLTLLFATRRRQLQSRCHQTAPMRIYRSKRCSPTAPNSALNEF